MKLQKQKSWGYVTLELISAFIVTVTGRLLPTFILPVGYLSSPFPPVSPALSLRVASYRPAN